MGTEGTINYTGTGFAEFSNLCNTTFVTKMFERTDAEIVRLFQIIIRPMLIIVGTVGNCLTIYIMRRTSLKHLSSCFFMVVLALADSGKFTLILFSLLKAKNFASDFPLRQNILNSCVEILAPWEMKYCSLSKIFLEIW